MRDMTARHRRVKRQTLHLLGLLAFDRCVGHGLKKKKGVVLWEYEYTVIETWRFTVRTMKHQASARSTASKQESSFASHVAA